MSEASRTTAAPHAARPQRRARASMTTGVGGAISAFFDRVRSGDLGSLPVVVGLVDHLDGVPDPQSGLPRRRNNLVNLLFDCSTVGVISLGIVCILMVGEIDLSVGSVSGFASALRRRALGQPGLAGGSRHPRRHGRRRG